MSETADSTSRDMTDNEVRDMVAGIFGNEGTGNRPVTPDSGYVPVTKEVVEVRTPTSTTRFHVPNEKVELEREKLDIARQERQVQGVRVHFPNPRFR